MKAEIITIGEVESKIPPDLSTRITKTFHPLIEKCQTDASFEIPQEAYDSERNQYQAEPLLEYIQSGTLSQEKRKILGITDKDLYSSGLNFIFGQADCPGSFALISLHRLDPEFYGQTADDDLFLERVVKEAVHELGHTFGLGHCTNSRCVMSFSNSILDVDQKDSSFCEDCQERLGI